ncbi:DUF308 domain-containing protein [Schaalia sp. ZJ1691]|uniref:DUF308 domain-containing protein n=1 Tax=Schaalia sp. ZJ1691 TaxID=2709404 RepID=UPI0013E9A05D|nr:DUF308 domain-containing protein [Schaalia sp. ZJ1691]
MTNPYGSPPSDNPSDPTDSAQPTDPTTQLPEQQPGEFGQPYAQTTPESSESPYSAPREQETTALPPYDQQRETAAYPYEAQPGPYATPGGPGMPGVPGTPGVPGMPGPAGAGAPNTTNVVGIIGLVLAIIGAVISLIPLVAFIGWIPLLAGLILGIVGLFLKNKKRGTAIAAVIIAVLGTIIAVVINLVFIGKLAETTHFDSSHLPIPGIEQHDDSSDMFEDSDDESSTPSKTAAGGVGTSRDNPAPLGTKISSDDWEVTVNSVNLNATDTILASNSFNEPPAEGETYILVNLTITYTGDDPQGEMPFTDVTYVSAEGKSFNTFTKSLLYPEQLDTVTTMYEGGSISGDIPIAVTAADVSKGVLAVAPEFGDTKVFVALQ